MVEISKHIVCESKERIRLLDYVIANVPEIISRNGAKKAIKKGAITLDGKIVESGRFVSAGQEVVHWQLNEDRKVLEEKLDVLFEDDFLAVVYKPAGMGTSGNYFRTLENALPYNLQASANAFALKYPQPVHRLDKATSGLIIVAKTSHTRIALGNMLEQGKIEKQYRAIVQGDLKGKGTMETTIDGKQAKSEFEALQHFVGQNSENFTLLSLSPITGRTHQLRIHLSQQGFPIVGDELYNSNKQPLKVKGLMLCSTGLEFKHPETDEWLMLAVELPKKFQTFIRQNS